MYTEQEKIILDYTKQKVKELFEKYSAPGHGFDHAEFTAKYAAEIAIKENARSVYMCEMAGYLHDIGRVAEIYDLGYGSAKFESGEIGHHELSYNMLKDWFTEASPFDQLTEEQKIELLYSVRNHWNNFADKYDTAWILRDADKLDQFGERGLARQLEYNAPDVIRITRSLRYSFDCYYWLKTKAARDIVKKQNMLEPVEKYYEQFLKERIREVE